MLTAFRLFAELEGAENAVNRLGVGASELCGDRGGIEGDPPRFQLSYVPLYDCSLSVS